MHVNLPLSSPADDRSPVPSRQRAPLGFAEAVELFIGRTRRTKSGSRNTERAYRGDLSSFHEFIGKRAVRYADVRRREAEAFITLLSAEVCARTVRRRVSTLHSFYRFLRGIDAAPCNPFASHDLPSFDPKSETHKVLSVEQLEQAAMLLSADVAAAQREADRTRGTQHTRAFAKLFVAARRRACFTLMTFAALRSHEVLSLPKSAIVTQSDGFALTFQGKGATTRTVPLVGFAYPALFDWLSVRRKVPTRAEYVFVTLNGKKVGSTQLERDCEAIGKRIRCAFTLTPHVLRRTCATRGLKASGDIRAVQEFLGHASIATTQLYTHVDTETLRNLVEMPGFAATIGAREHARGPLVRSAS